MTVLSSRSLSLVWVACLLGLLGCGDDGDGTGGAGMVAGMTAGTAGMTAGTAGMTAGTGAGTSAGTAAPMPTFSAVYQDIFVATGCNGGALCHGGPTGGLQMTDKQATYDALVGVQAMGLDLTMMYPNCADSGLVRVVPFEPDNSLLVQKIDVPAGGMPPCGQQMPMGVPLARDKIDLIREWIAAGAENN